jgi:hypothetical protein
MDGSYASGFVLEVACPFVGLGSMSWYSMSTGFIPEVACPLRGVDCKMLQGLN